MVRGLTNHSYLDLKMTNVSLMRGENYKYANMTSVDIAANKVCYCHVEAFYVISFHYEL